MLFRSKEKIIEYYMDVAFSTSILSTAKKLKVGAVLVKNGNIIGFSYNGTPRGWDNECEEKIWMGVDAGGWLDIEQIEKQWPFEEHSNRYALKTKPEVSHAEENLILKLARSTESSDGSVMFVTHNPCYTCSRMIYGAGITKVFYENEYRDSSGIEFLNKCGVEVNRYVRRNNQNNV